MSSYVTFASSDQHDAYKIKGIYPTLALANAAAAGDATLTSLPNEFTGDQENELDLDRYVYGDSPYTISDTPPKTTAEQKKYIKNAAKEHARDVLDLMVGEWWIGDGLGSRPSSGNRWSNTRRWIMSMAACVVAACNNANWTVDECQNALNQMQAYAPADRNLIRKWYFAHEEAIWSGYFTLAPVKAHFKHTKTDAGTQNFAADASSANVWDGSGGTLAITLTADSTPESL